jgi:hypothetical protein
MICVNMVVRIVDIPIRIMSEFYFCVFLAFNVINNATKPIATSSDPKPKPNIAFYPLFGSKTPMRRPIHPSPQVRTDYDLTRVIGHNYP